MPYIEKLKMIKEEKDITNLEIAKLSNIPLATVTRIFNGNTPNPTFETISQIAIALGASLDEIIGLKQPDETPISSPIETTLNSYIELLKIKDDRISELKDEKEKERREKHWVAGALVVFVVFVLTILTIDIMNGHFGYFTY